MGIMISVSSNSHRSLNGLQENIQTLFKSMEKLSSGLSINSAADNPAGLIISEQLRSQIAGLNQRIANVTSSIHKYQTASSSISMLRTSLIELRSLALGAANEGLNSEAAQQAFDVAAQDLVQTYNSAIDNVRFNGKTLLDGSEGALASIDDLSGIDLSSGATAVESIEQIDAAFAGLNQVTIELGTTQKYELESRLASLEVARENLVAAESQRRDTDYASEMTNYIAGMIRSRMSAALLSHGNITRKAVLQLLGS